MQHVLATELYPVVNLWPFRAWAMDLIGMIYPPSSRKHRFIVVASNYFSKWVEAIPMKSVDQSNLSRVLKENIICRFGLPKTIVANQGTMFTGREMLAFSRENGFAISHSIPYYAQGNS